MANGRKAKLDDRTVMMVRDLRAAGVPEARLAAMAGVHAATVRQVVSARTWRGLPPGDASRGASVLLSLPELLTGREALLVSTALSLTDGARDDHVRLYRAAPGAVLMAVGALDGAPVPVAVARRGPSQLAADALSHPSRWRGGPEQAQSRDAALVAAEDSRWRRRRAGRAGPRPR
jgi:hypothetical protein